MELQIKMLRMLQEWEFRPLGSNESRKADVRIIAASSSPLRQLVTAGRFREDLFYRLYVYPIQIPSLSERREDIPLLAGYFVKIFSQEQKKAAEFFHEKLMDYLKMRDWPGNIRELENLVERLVTIAPADAKVLGLDLLPAGETPPGSTPSKNHGRKAITSPLKKILAEYEKEVLQNVLDDCGWNLSKASRILSISEHAMRYKATKLKLKRPSKK